MPNFTAYIIYVLTATITPGPNNILILAHANKYGFKKTLNLVAGIVSGFFVVLVLSNYLNLFLYNIIPRITMFMSIFGAAFMIYLAVLIVKSSSEGNHSENKLYEDKNLFLIGLLLQFINPKGILFSITITGNFIIPYYQSNTAILGFSLLTAVIGLCAALSWTSFGSLFNKFLSMYEKQFNIVMGILLIYLAYTIIR